MFSSQQILLEFCLDLQVEEYKAVNLKESHDLADAFLAYPFLDAQYRFLKSKGKSQTAAMFWVLKTTRPIWSKFL